MRGWIVFAALAVSCSAVAQQWGSDDGPDRQVVSPDAALGEYGSGFGASWRSYVEQHPHYSPRSDPEETCAYAVNELFDFACGDHHNCEIEAKYDEKCLSDGLDEGTARRCVKVVGDYARQCFGEGCSPYTLKTIASLLRKSGETVPFCSAATFVLPTPDSRPEPVLVTAPHCEERIDDDTVVFGRIQSAVLSSPARVERRQPDSPTDGITNRLTLYFVDDFRANDFVPMRPEIFKPTVFRGFNRLIASRNKVLESSVLSQADLEGEPTYSALRCDSSRLCTVVKIDGDELWHTCQSTKGGSGGALYQDHGNGRVGIVGVND